MGLLDGFEVMSLAPKKGSSVLTVSKSNIRFNKASAAELGFPPFVKMLANAKTNQVAVKVCSEKDPAAVQFCDSEKKQNYAIFIKIPALLAEFRRLLDFGEAGIEYSMNGTTYADEQASIYDLNSAEKGAGKWTGKKKKQSEPVEQRDGEE